MKKRRAMLKEWLNQRALLNHDILCNQLRNEILSLRSDPTQTQTPRLKMWPKRKHEYEIFLDKTIEALSFASILDDHVFDSWQDSLKSTSKPIFHQLFLATTDISKRVDDLKRLLDESVEAALYFNTIEPAKRTVDMIVSLQKKVEALSNGISSLPNNPRII